MQVLEFQALTAGYNDIPVTTEISLALSSGEIVALLGPNGAGKSTLLKAVVGEARVFSGSVLLRGTNVTGWPPERLARMGLGYVPQNDNVFASLTVRENLEMGAFRAPRREVSEKIEEIVRRFPPLGPLIRRKVSQLSGGERRLVAIGRALIPSPEVLVLDEPTANLSPGNAHSVLTEYVTQVAAAGTGVLLVEQRAKEALQIAHRAFMMSAGRIEVSGPSVELLKREDIGRLFLGETTRKP